MITLVIRSVFSKYIV